MLKLEVEVKAKPQPGKNIPGWNTGDLEFLTNRKALAKLHSNFSRIGHKVNARIILDTMHKTREKQVHLETVILPDHINFTMLNNVTTIRNWIPTTSWIICHRMAHAMISEDENNPHRIWTKEYAAVDGPEYALWCGLGEIWNLLIKPDDVDTAALTNFQHRGTSREHWSAMAVTLNRMNDWAPVLVSTLFTMRSARDRLFANELDVFAEAWAQFMVTGSFKMRRVSEDDLGRLRAEEWSPDTNVTSWGSRSSYYNRPFMERLQEIQPQQAPLINQRIEELELVVNSKMKILAQNLVGKHLVF